MKTQLQMRWILVKKTLLLHSFYTMFTILSDALFQLLYQSLYMTSPLYVRY